MGLKATINNATLTAFKALGDLNTPMTFNSATGQVVRDLDAGITTAVVVTYTLKYSCFVRWTQQENDKDASTLSSSKLIFPRFILPVEPKMSDTLTDAEGRNWEVLKVLHEPSESVGKLQVRTAN